MSDTTFDAERLVDTIGKKVTALLLVMLVMAAITVGVVYYYQSQSEAYGDAVNVAGQQSVLSQEMSAEASRIAGGDGDADALAAAIDSYNENLVALSEGGETGDVELDSPPDEVTETIETKETTWRENEYHAENVVRYEPYNEEFEGSYAYVRENESALNDRSDGIASAYLEAAADDPAAAYEAEIEHAHRLGTLSREMTTTSVDLADAAAEGDDEAVGEHRQELKAAIDEYDAILAALSEGGTYDGTDFQEPPAGVEAELADTRDVWDDYEYHAETVYAIDRLEPRFWTALEYIDEHDGELQAESAALSDELAAVSADSITFMQRIMLGLFGLNVVVFGIGAVITRRRIGEPLATISRKADAIADRDLEVDIPESEREDEVGQLYGSFRRMRDNLNDLISGLEETKDEAEAARADAEAAKADAEEAKVEAEEAKAEAEAFNEHLRRTATEYREIMDRTANGDLTVRMEPDTESEAMAEIARTFNEMVEDLEETVVAVHDVAVDVDEVSEEVASGVEEIENASGEVSDSAEEISTAASRQSDRFEEALGEMNDLSATVEEIASTSEEVAEVSDRAAERAQAGSEAAGDAIAEIDQLEERTDAITERVESLDSEMDRIGEIVELIDDIADQTNLLALNASIEAARAGEDGERFGVVASEVKSLAEETADATTEVDDLISGVREATEETVAEVEAMGDEVDSSVDTVEDSLLALEEIVERIEEANDGIQSINDVTDDQANASQRVATMVEEATELSQDTDAETESVAAAAEEQTATVAEISMGTDRLAERADDLNDALDEFDVGNVSDSGTDDVTLGYDEE